MTPVENKNCLKSHFAVYVVYCILCGSLSIKKQFKYHTQVENGEAEI